MTGILDLLIDNQHEMQIATNILLASAAILTGVLSAVALWQYKPDFNDKPYKR